MALSKQETREALLRLCGMWNAVVTTDAGASDGSTFITTDYTGYGSDIHEAMWATVRSGTHAGKYRQVSIHSSGTFSLVRAFGSGAIASAITIELCAVRPDIVTDAMNRAIVEVWPYVYLPALDSSITLTSGDLTYAMPSGVTAEMIARVATEGEDNTPWDGRPRYIRDDWEVQPGDTNIWLGANTTSKWKDVQTGRLLYLFLRKYLTRFGKDTTFGALVTDTTAAIELTEGTDAFDLYLMYARACLYEVLAAAPMTQNKGEYIAAARAFRDMAKEATPAKRMRALDRPLMVG